MKLKNKQLEAIINTIMPFATSPETPFKTMYWIKRFLIAIRTPTEAFNETKQMILEKHADRDENGKIITVGNGNMQFSKNVIEVNRELNGLGNIDIDLPASILQEPHVFVVNKPLQKFVTAQTMLILDGIIEFEVPEEEQPKPAPVLSLVKPAPGEPTPE
jgi:hypothetical protein